MEFKHLKELSCPVCGDHQIIEEKILRDSFTAGKIMVHANGQRWESRMFSCGQLIEHVPNYSKSELSKSQVCLKNKEYIDMINNREIAKENLLIIVAKLEVDDVFKNQIKERIQYL